MGILHDELQRVMTERWSDASLASELLQRTLRNRGLAVSDEHLPQLAQHLMEGADSIEVLCDGDTHTIAITDEDIERAIREFETAEEDGAEAGVLRIVEAISPPILQSLYDTLPQSLKEWHAAQRAFEERL